MKKRWSTIINTIVSLGLLLPGTGFAQADVLREIYEQRPDLQSAFEEETLQGIQGSAAGFLIDLEDWARQYGWQLYEELAAYAPDVTPVQPSGVLPAPEVTAASYIVLDDASGAILAAHNAGEQQTIASITKLVTTKVALDLGLDGAGVGDVLNSDNVGGARLWVEDGTTFTVVDLLKATIVASANNAANALARLTGYESAVFLQHMNEFADSLNLRSTVFADPTGIELGNISTAREVAEMARTVFEHEDIRRLSGRSRIHIDALNDDEYVRDITTTNWLLYDAAYDDVYVTAGKTGYLEGWNVVVRMHPMGGSIEDSVLIVILNAQGRRESFDDAANLARWAWTSFDWETRRQVIQTSL